MLASPKTSKLDLNLQRLLVQSHAYAVVYIGYSGLVIVQSRTRKPDGFVLSTVPDCEHVVVRDFGFVKGLLKIVGLVPTALHRVNLCRRLDYRVHELINLRPILANSD